MTNLKVVIRSARPDESVAIATLLTELGYPSNAGDIPGRMSGVLAHGGAVVVAVTEDDTPLGLMALAPYWGLHTAGPSAYIIALVIAATARRRGVGKALVDYAKRWAVDNGCERLVVTSAEHRSDAHAFYPSMGMPYTGRRFSASLEMDGR
ncbi:MAG: GNAT family N-acetyltransferase [Gemmatimonadaceae bacterium]